MGHRNEAVCALLLAALLAWVGCGGREHKNPFDPLNPETGGDPDVAWAEARCSEVRVTWQTLKMHDLRGVRVWRSEAASPGASAELLNDPPLPPTRESYRDTSAVNGVEYDYTVEFLFAGEDRANLSPVTAQPGSALPWVSDACGWGLAQVSPDGRTQLQRRDFGSVVMDVDADADRHLIFATYSDTGQLFLLDSRSGDTVDAFSADGATCVSWSADLAVAAVGAFYERTVSWFALDGTRLAHVDVPGAIEDIALRDSSTTWVPLNEGSLLRLAIGNPVPETMPVDLIQPEAVADDAEGGGCWVSDRGAGGVVYVSDEGTAVWTAEGALTEPFGLDADGEGGCWVADFRGRALVRIGRDCQVLERISDIGFVASVTVDRETGDLWTTLPDNGLLRRVRAVDRKVIDLRVSGCPIKVAGDWTGGCAD